MINLIFSRYYTAIYRNFTGDQNFYLELNKERETFVNNLFKRLNKEYPYSIGEQFLWDYLVFQFNYYSDKKTRFGNRVMRLNWVTGDVAVKRFKEKGNNWLYFNQQFLLKFNIKKPETSVVEEDGNKDYKKKERLRFYNKKRGLLHCIEMDLFDKYSLECLNCKFKKDCYG